MKHNMTYSDRIIRAIIAVILIAAYLSGKITGIAGIVFITVAAVFVLTAFLNFCPLYRALGIRKWERKQAGVEK